MYREKKPNEKIGQYLEQQMNYRSKKSKEKNNKIEGMVGLPSIL